MLIHTNTLESGHSLGSLLVVVQLMVSCGIRSFRVSRENATTKSWFNVPSSTFGCVSPLCFIHHEKGLQYFDQSIPAGYTVPDTAKCQVITKFCSERIAKYAFEYAYLNNRKTETAVHKANIMKLADGLFLESCREVAKNYPGIKYNEVIVDNCCMQLVSKPQQFDVMVTFHDPSAVFCLLDIMALFDHFNTYGGISSSICFQVVYFVQLVDAYSCSHVVRSWYLSCCIFFFR